MRALVALLLCFAVLPLTGCAPLLIAGGAVGGYAIAKDANNNQPPASKK